jgi:hypothetical protein
MSEKVREAALWTLALVAIAITIAAGTRIVAWVVQGETTGIWKAAIGLVLAASGGGFAATAIRRGGDNGEH